MVATGRDAKRWLASFHLKTSLRLKHDEETLTGRYGGGDFHLQNVKREHGEAYYLDAKFILEAEGLDDAHELADERAAEFTHTLSYVSGASVKVHRPVFLIDWTPGVEERDQYVYGQFPFVDPVDAVDASLLRTLEVVSDHEVTSAKRAALRWHTRGTRAEILEDQFLYHFFAIEILAAAEASVGKVVDKCPTCKGDLVCPNPACGHPEHRPFPKQKVAQLLMDIGLQPAIIEALLEIRNLLSHGEERKQLVAHMKKASADFELEKAVFVLAEAATKALHRALAIPEQTPPLAFYYLENPEHVTVKVRSHMRIGLPGDPFAPNIGDIWMAELSTIVIDPKTGDEEIVHLGGSKAKPAR